MYRRGRFSDDVELDAPVGKADARPVRFEGQHLESARPAIVGLAQAPVPETVGQPFQVHFGILEDYPGDHQPFVPQRFQRQRERRFAGDRQGALGVGPWRVLDVDATQAHRRLEGKSQLHRQVGDLDRAPGFFGKMALERRAQPVPVEQRQCERNDEHDTQQDFRLAAEQLQPKPAFHSVGKAGHCAACRIGSTNVRRDAKIVCTRSNRTAHSRAIPMLPPARSHIARARRLSP